ncbi:DNA-binding transcriptional LysR family regulator [Mesocricetibacter intestinalis]|uniref:DNA-binding transcriptional LysR family regulator n=1 Tax=Mesocricetibacter intestinalis TaxID=1521930 RepID=A0A4R6VFN2_9PAST|nr:LysR family transcriptional regulator [Mesocricetibacter intestinalis]TDQ59571.1 DNA-binding transcriptional LysR family regulator [Mesocricetibacter intestinalis]
MNRLDALKYFVVAAETLSFRATAERFSVSPQVITRVMGELETELGEQLFKRNTRSIRLTDFGIQWLPQAEQFLQQEQVLFGMPAKLNDNELSGVVRITVPPSAYSDWVLKQLLLALAPYPAIRIDWRTGFNVLKAVEDQIDIGVRITQRPEDNWIARKIRMLNEPIVAAPALIELVGQPENIEDLLARFPIGSLLNSKTNRPWAWSVNDEFIPIYQADVVTDDTKALLQAVLAGRIFAPLPYMDCQHYFATGELVKVFPYSESQKWAYYLYRPKQTITAKRVLLVYELLEKIYLSHRAA